MSQLEDKSHLDHLRHSAAHLLAAAVLKLWPQAKNAIGPSIENGFYQDFDMGNAQVSEEDLAHIEQTMQQILQSWDTFELREVSVDQAKQDFSWNPYKSELIQEFAQAGKKITETKQGGFLDLCKGGHVDNLSKELKHFKLLSIAGAYWRGDEKNPMLTRIYGTAFPTQKELDKYLWQLQEAKKRDHRKLGQQLDLFHFQAEAPGMPFWHPKGMVLRNQLLNFSRQLQAQYGYQEIQTPILMRHSIFKQSGHWDHYKDDMFFTPYENKTDLMALKPMNCPGMIQIYKSSPRSYRNLPLKFSEYGIITRKEQPGELNGLFRVMQAWQDDAHLFVTQTQIPQVVQETINLVNQIYQPFNIKYKAYLSTRPDKFMGKKSTWDKAEAALKKAMTSGGLKLLLKEKEGAFYGPKIDYDLEDSLGRNWQCATIQLDFQMPHAFSLEYTGEDGQPHQPVIIHRTIMGSIERFIGILIEHYAGAFPTWLAPVQVKIIPISAKHHEYAQKVATSLSDNQIRVEVDNDAQSMQKRIRTAEMAKIPYIVVVGDREVESNSANIRRRGTQKHASLPLDKFMTQIQKEIETKTAL